VTVGRGKERKKRKRKKKKKRRKEKMNYCGAYYRKIMGDF